jgi:hypothetical protein
MAMTIDECVARTHIKEKITAIIPTSQADIKFLMLAVFSFLLRSEMKNGLLEHICICINGPDERTGETKIQDKKQAFLEDLRNLKWWQSSDPTFQKDMPLTVIRAWSRIGWSEPMCMAINWVHTDSYIIAHDDIILNKTDWESEIKEKFYGNEAVAIASWGDLLGCELDYWIHKGMYLLRFPQMQTTFLVCKKSSIMKAGGVWPGYHIPSDDNFLQFDLNDLEDYNNFIDFWKNKNLLSRDLVKSELYNFVRQEVGAWVYYNLITNNYKFEKLSDDLLVHFEGMSRTWEAGHDEIKKKALEKHNTEVLKLETEILSHPQYSELYKKYSA